MENNCSVTPRPKTVKEFFKSWYFWKPFIAVVLGGLGGFLYFYFIGCQSGTCPITSNYFGSIVTGAIIGFFVTNGPCASCRTGY